jgi:hypothetical protein
MMLPHAFEGRLRGKYNLAEPSAWKALDRDARLHAEALSSISSECVAPRAPGVAGAQGVEGARRFNPASVTFEDLDSFELYRYGPLPPKLSER